jgi:hypothetical protein
MLKVQFPAVQGFLGFTQKAGDAVGQAVQSIASPKLEDF